LIVEPIKPSSFNLQKNREIVVFSTIISAKAGIQGKIAMSILNGLFVDKLS